MSNTCGGWDNTAPTEIVDAMKGLIRKANQANKDPNKKPRDYVDAPDCCLLEDLEGERCPPGKCRYDKDGNLTPNYGPHKKV